MSLLNQNNPATPTNTNSSVPSTASMVAGLRAMSPLYRARAEAFNDSLPNSVDVCLKTYFKELNGMSPVNGMYDKVIAQVERPLIEHVLRYVRCNQVRAAIILGINRNTLRKKIQTLNIDLNKLVAEGGLHH